MKTLVLILLAAVSVPVAADANVLGGRAGDVFLLGEVHDNPAHHLNQAAAMADIGPKAVVFEMLTPDMAAKVTEARLSDPEALAEALDWEASGWPDFAIYAPVFAGLAGVQVFGAMVPRDETRLALEIGVSRAFGAEDADIFGLDDPLDEEELAARLNHQFAAHCGALPTELLPSMVDIQRLRDATLARAVLDAYRATGGRVVVITGNGHARTDWGVARYLERVVPELVVVAVGQGENGEPPDGTFDLVLDAPGVERDDPCDAFDTGPGE